MPPHNDHVTDLSTPTALLAARLRAAIAAHRATVAVIGLGYVGLPLSLAFAEKGFRVLGLDVDEAKVRTLEAGQSYIERIAASRVAAVRLSDCFAPTADFARLSEAEVIIVCVPTPLGRHREPDLGFVERSAERMASTLRPGQLVILESTTYPTTTEFLLREALEVSGLRCGVDFFLAFSPEREDPGNPAFDTTTIPKVVGGVDPLSGDLAEALYAAALTRTVRVSHARVAEATKLTENIFRAVNIALVNELKVIYERMGIDIWEVLDAAETKPFGFMRFDPGPGWGGHCIPLDPFYLAWKAREYGVDTKFIELAGEINRNMPTYVVQRLQNALNERGKSLRGAKVLALGLAYKRDVSDVRESPALEILRLLLELGAEVGYHDPHVTELPRTRDWGFLPKLRSQPLSPALLRGHDAIVVVTDHAGVDYELVAQHAQLVIDTRGVYRAPRSNVVKA